MAVATTDPVRLPPAPRIPKLLQGVGFVAAREKSVAALAKRYGSAFTLRLPIFGETVVVSDPALIKDLFTTNTDLIARAGVLGEMFGPGSTFSLDGTEHRERRKLLVPPFHGKRMASYEGIIEEEVLRETASWPEGREFETMPSMMRITLNAILRTVFGAEGAALDELRELLPPMVLNASRLAVMPPIVRRDFGAVEPGREADVVSRALRRDHPATDLRHSQRPEVRGTQRRPHADAAGALRGRLTDLRRPCRRRAADLARRRPRDHRDDAGMGGRAAAPTPAAARAADRRGRRGRFRAGAGHDLGGAAHPPGDQRHGSDDEDPDPVGGVGHSGAPRRPCQHLAGARLRGQLRRREGVQSRPIRRQPAGQLRVDSLRRRSAPLHRRGVREHGDERHAADIAARVRVRHDVRPR